LAGLTPPFCQAAASRSTAKYVDLVGWVTGDAAADVSEPGVGIDLVHLGGDDQAVH
jgi:hypothetical protein